jgi:hypothetical protein
MTRNSAIHPGSIGNGVYARVRRTETIGEAYRRIQRTCKHEKPVRHLLSLWASDAIRTRA